MELSFFFPQRTTRSCHVHNLKLIETVLQEDSVKMIGVTAVERQLKSCALNYQQKFENCDTN